MEEEAPRSRSRRENGEREEESNRGDPEKARKRDRDSQRKERESRRSAKERSSDDKHRDARRSERESYEDKHHRDSRRSEKEMEKERGKEKDREGSVDDKYLESRRSEQERGVDDKHRVQRRSEREGSVDEKYRESRRSEREDSVDDKYNERDRESRHKVKEKERAKEKEKAREKEREAREKERRREKEKAKEQEERERAQEEVERERERAKEEEERERERERERVRELEKREEEREDREREKKKERERARELERREEEREDREREKKKERESQRERERERDRRRRECDRDEDEDARDYDRKRRRREDPHDKERERSSRAERHYREGSEEGRRKKSDYESEIKEKTTTAEDDADEEQRKLDEEMEKRRRRVQEWQELRRKKEDQEGDNTDAVNGDKQLELGKKWTLEGESDDEEAASNEKTVEDAKAEGAGNAPMNVDNENDNSLVNGNVADTDVEEIDPLDAFMNALEVPEDVEMDVEGDSDKRDDKKLNTENNFAKVGVRNGDPQNKGKKTAMGRIIPGEDSGSDYDDVENDKVNLEEEDDDEFMKRVKKTKVEKLTLVDHSKIKYPPFRKNFYIEVKELLKMTPEEVADYRKQLELKIHGKDVPKPVKTWNQTGLTSKVLETIRKLNFEKPMPIQCQALPVIMSGRDCIGIAKTGSGKTLAFVLPMIRHIKDQPPVVPGDGPIGLIMAPTRELVQQIHSDVRKFSKAAGLICVPVYGGSGIAQQISDLKRGAEIVVCTPGRMIDILCTSNGKISNLRRVTYLVMDEADRMFDMGFEPQITRIVQNTRPDRQTVLFSATFPRQVEILARRVLNKPIEIQVGGRSVVNKDIAQSVEVRQENERFFRLLELLGEWYEKGKILVFVQSQDKCDALFKDLLRHGYPCLSLHGAKDQTDRESTISDFKSNVCNLLIATSVAARGLDVKELELVVNFDAPNHYEDYVHRVGRTGRAGRKGFAVTFISEDDARYAPDLVKALELSEQAVPEDLKSLADGFMAKVNQGTERAHGTGYGGSGFKFNEEEDEERKAAKKAQAREYGFEEDKSESESEDDGVRKAGGDLSQAAVLAQAAALAAAASKASMTSMVPATAAQLLPNGGLSGINIPGLTALQNAGLTVTALPGEAAARAAALAAAMNLKHNLAKIQADAMPEHYEAELEINDFPQNARWKVTHKETIGPISDWTGAAITTRGQYCAPGRIPAQGERKLYLFIEGPSESSVKKAKAMLKQVLEDFTAQSLNLPGAAQPGKYSVL